MPHRELRSYPTNYATDLTDEKSDIDSLVRMAPGRSLLDLGGLQYDLEQLPGCRVDVVTEQGLKARLREEILSEAVTL